MVETFKLDTSGIAAVARTRVAHNQVHRYVTEQSTEQATPKSSAAASDTVVCCCLYIKHPHARMVDVMDDGLCIMACPMVSLVRCSSNLAVALRRLDVVVGHGGIQLVLTALEPSLDGRHHL